MPSVHGASVGVNAVGSFNAHAKRATFGRQALAVRALSLTALDRILFPNGAVPLTLSGALETCTGIGPQRRSPAPHEEWVSFALRDDRSFEQEHSGLKQKERTELSELCDELQRLESKLDISAGKKLVKGVHWRRDLLDAIRWLELVGIRVSMTEHARALVEAAATGEVNNLKLAADFGAQPRTISKTLGRLGRHVLSQIRRNLKTCEDLLGRNLASAGSSFEDADSERQAKLAAVVRAVAILSSPTENTEIADPAVAILMKMPSSEAQKKLGYRAAADLAAVQTFPGQQPVTSLVDFGVALMRQKESEISARIAVLVPQLPRFEAAAGQPFRFSWTVKQQAALTLLKALEAARAEGGRGRTTATVNHFRAQLQTTPDVLGDILIRRLFEVLVRGEYIEFVRPAYGEEAWNLRLRGAWLLALDAESARRAASRGSGSVPPTGAAPPSEQRVEESKADHGTKGKSTSARVRQAAHAILGAVVVAAPAVAAAPPTTALAVVPSVALVLRVRPYARTASHALEMRQQDLQDAIERIRLGMGDQVVAVQHIVADLNQGIVDPQRIDDAVGALLSELEDLSIPESQNAAYRALVEGQIHPASPPAAAVWRDVYKTMLVRRVRLDARQLEFALTTVPSLDGNKEWERKADRVPYIDSDLRESGEEALAKLRRWMAVKPAGPETLERVVREEPEGWVGASIFASLLSDRPLPGPLLPSIPVPRLHEAFDRLRDLDPNSKDFDAALGSLVAVIKSLKWSTDEVNAALRADANDPVIEYQLRRSADPKYQDWIRRILSLEKKPISPQHPIQPTARPQRHPRARGKKRLLSAA